MFKLLDLIGIRQSLYFLSPVAVGITGAEESADGLERWNFTPIGLAVNAAAYADDVNSKIPTMIVES
ncbi:MAG: hypothetical protein P8L39_11165 [Halioglobus sp.]|nr:hypothetical protein [Halioglobus sp.]